MAALVVASDDSKLARGWAKMQDQHGDYYINLYTKETSRIRPVRASIFQKGAFPAPPPEEPQEQNSDPISPISNPLSPHSQQQAQQQQVYNQQLYQQRWQNYYNQRSYAPQQWQFHQQPHGGPHPQNEMMSYHNPPNVFPNQMQHIQQQQQQQRPFYPQRNANAEEDEDEDEDEEESSSTSSSTVSSCTDTASLSEGTGSEDEDEDEPQEKPQSQPQNQQPQKQLNINEIPPPNSSAPKQQKLPKAVPPVKQHVNNRNQNNKAPPVQQFRFQPIVPPNLNMGLSNDSVHSANNNMPSPAFNPDKIAAMISHKQLPEAALATNPSALEGNVAQPQLPAPPNPVIEHHESMIFGAMLQQKDKKEHLAREENWEMLCDGIQSNCPLQDQYDVFKAMRKVAKNLLLDDEKYRVLYADNDMVQKKILGRVGGYEFLRGVGFKRGNEENELLVSRVDKTIVNNAIKVMQKRIDVLKKKRHEWDPKYKKKKAVIKNDANQVDEEQRQLEEAIRLSQQQHVQDMLKRQQKELDQHQKSWQQKSVNIYSPHAEDDYKAAHM